MKINIETKTNSLSGFSPVCIVLTGDGTYRGVWEVNDENSDYMTDLENDENVISYSIN